MELRYSTALPWNYAIPRLLPWNYVIREQATTRPATYGGGARRIRIDRGRGAADDRPRVARERYVATTPTHDDMAMSKRDRFPMPSRTREPNASVPPDLCREDPREGGCLCELRDDESEEAEDEDEEAQWFVFELGDVFLQGISATIEVFAHDEEEAFELARNAIMRYVRGLPWSCDCGGEDCWIGGIYIDMDSSYLRVEGDDLA